MEIKKLSGLSKLAVKASLVFGSALAALSGGDATTTNLSPTEEANSGNTIEFQAQAAKKKPMPLLRLNLNNPEQSVMIAQHGSHSSHSSHSSHYSHRSGAMFS